MTVFYLTLRHGYSLRGNDEDPENDTSEAKSTSSSSPQTVQLSA